MDRAISIAIALLVSLGVYLGFVFVLRKEKNRHYFSESWFLHPNAICAWRVLIGFSGMVLYFILGEHFWGILLFTLSAVMDGVDGLIARSCKLGTPFGQEIDPLCDKLTYLPAMFFFAQQGLLDMTVLWVLILIEACGQFAIRAIIKRFTLFSVGANNFGKIKAVVCFALIIYCALLDGAYRIPDFTDQILAACVILSIASSIFKLISNRFYADILSLLNLVCGITGIFLLFQGRFVLTAIAILTGQIFDLFDGRIAEKHGGTKFGPWLDDIADMVSFGVCPGLLILMRGDMQIPAWFFGAVYLLAVAFRLWRFLIRDKHDDTLPAGIFNGLPSPAGAMVVLGACLFWEKVWISWIVILIISYLLVSHVQFLHFGRVILNRISRPIKILMGFVIVLIIAYLIKARDPQLLGAILLLSFMVYVIIGNNRFAGRYIMSG